MKTLLKLTDNYPTIKNIIVSIAIKMSIIPIMFVFMSDSPFYKASLSFEIGVFRVDK